MANLSILLNWRSSRFLFLIYCVYVITCSWISENIYSLFLLARLVLDGWRIFEVVCGWEFSTITAIRTLLGGTHLLLQVKQMLLKAVEDHEDTPSYSFLRGWNFLFFLAMSCAFLPDSSCIYRLLECFLNGGWSNYWWLPFGDLIDKSVEPSLWRMWTRKHRTHSKRTFRVLKSYGGLNETPEDSTTSRPAAWAAGLQECNISQLRDGVNHWVYFRYRRRFYRLNFLSYLLSVSALITTRVRDDFGILR